MNAAINRPYLARLKALISEKGPLLEVPKVPEGAFDTFGTNQGRHFLENECSPGTAAISEKDLPGEVPKPTKGAFGAFLDFESAPAIYAEAFRALWLDDCPAYVEPEDWRLARYDANAFMQTWGEQSARLGWTAADLFGLPPVLANPAPHYRRLSRYERQGLVWLLHGRPVLALTEDAAIIRGHQGGKLTYRRHFDRAGPDAGQHDGSN